MKNYLFCNDEIQSLQFYFCWHHRNKMYPKLYETYYLKTITKFFQIKSHTNLPHQIQIHHIKYKFTKSITNSPNQLQIHHIKYKLTSHEIQNHHIYYKFTTSNTNSSHQIKIILIERANSSY